MGWTTMRLNMRLTATKRDLKEELEKKPKLQNAGKISALKKEISDLEKQIDKAKED